MSLSQKTTHKSSESGSIRAYQQATNGQYVHTSKTSPLSYQSSSFRERLLIILKGKPKNQKSASPQKKQSFRFLDGDQIKQNLMSLFLFRLRLLPMVIFFAVLVLGVRSTTFISHVKQKGFMDQAIAAVKPKENRQVPLSHLDEKVNKKTGGAAGKPIEALNDFDPFNMTAEQYQVLKGIVNKSESIEDRARSISEKEQLLQALLKKLDEKVKELKLAKSELQKLVNQIDEEENANTTRLVKMTEGMEPQQAAAILQDVDFPILLEIMERLKEKKAAAILASMDAKKAGYLMSALSKRRKIFKKDNPEKALMQG